MASLINVIIPLETFLDEFGPLMKKYAMHIYIENKIGQTCKLKKVLTKEDLLMNANEHYHGAFLTSLAFTDDNERSIYDDDFCIHAIEVRGGRSTASEIENLSLRIISKTPDQNVKRFFNKLLQNLKRSDRYGIGVGEGLLFGKTFYNRAEVAGKTVWFDFQRKTEQLEIDLR